MSEWGYLQPINESYREPSGLHATNPFEGDVETVSSSNARTEDAADAIIANIFLEIMSDNVSNADQIAEMASASHPEPSRASPTAQIQWMALRQRAKATPGLPWRSRTTVSIISQTPMIAGE